MTERRVMNAYFETPNTYIVGWDIAPATKYAHETLVEARSEIEALEYLIGYLNELTSCDIDAWII